MEDIIYFNNLYDLYGTLLTEKQKHYFEDYYFNNLSLGEMAENYKVSRNAIFRQIRIVTDKLEDFEKKLHLYERNQKIINLTSQLSDTSLRNKIEELL